MTPIIEWRIGLIMEVRCTKNIGLQPGLARQGVHAFSIEKSSYKKVSQKKTSTHNLRMTKPGIGDEIPGENYTQQHTPKYETSACCGSYISAVNPC